MLFDFECGDHQIWVALGRGRFCFLLGIPELLVHEDPGLFVLFEDEFGSGELYFQFLGGSGERFAQLHDRVDQYLSFLCKRWSTLSEICAYLFLVTEVLLLFAI